MPAREWLISHMPARVRPPGDYAAYSNYGAMLAGYIVARVSGQPYDQYIQEHILDPLGMAALNCPVADTARPARTCIRGIHVCRWRLSGIPRLHGSAGGDCRPAQYHASVTDMARFMIAHLQDGRYSDANIAEARILKETTAQQMHSTLYTPDPRLLGTAYGFFDFSDNGQRTIGHSGYARADAIACCCFCPTRTWVYLWPTTAMVVGDLTNQHFGFQRAFFDHYYPAPAVDPIQPPADFAERAGRFVGSYQTTPASSYTTLEKITGSSAPSVEISDPGDGTLLLTTPWGEWRFVEVEPLYFRQVDGPFGIVFREDDQGRITHLFTDLTPHVCL